MYFGTLLVTLLRVTDLSTWWQQLRPETRERLAGNPHGLLPAHLWAEVARHEAVSLVPLRGADGGYRLPSAVADFVREGASG